MKSSPELGCAMAFLTLTLSRILQTFPNIPKQTPTEPSAYLLVLNPNLSIVCVLDLDGNVSYRFTTSYSTWIRKA